MRKYFAAALLFGFLFLATFLVRDLSTRLYHAEIDVAIEQGISHDLLYRVDQLEREMQK